MVPPLSLPRTLVALALVGALLGAAFAVPAAASPRPIQVCSPCERGFTYAAQSHDVDVEIERSTATMRVHRNGSATWTVENRLNDTAAFENASLRQAVAEEAILVHDARLLSTSVSGDTVRMRYRTSDAATEASGGVLRVEYFRDDPGAMVRSGLGADRLTLVAPEGMAVGHALPGADVSGREMTVTSFDGGGDGPFVTLVPEGDPLAPLWSLVAVTLPLVPVVGRNLAFLVAIPTLVFVGGLRAVAWAVSAAGLDPAAATSDRRALVVVALALLALAHPLAPGLFALGGVEPPLVAGAAGAVVLGGALAVPAVRARLSVARLAGLVGLAFVVAVAVGVLLRALTDLHVTEQVVRRMLVVLPVYAVTLVGYAAAHGRLRAALAAAAGAFALVLVTTFPILSQGGTLYFLGVAVAVIGAIGAAIVGIPLFLLGHSLPRTGTPPTADGGTADD
ncbi:hypothetical protein DU500_04470 [Haloplanus rubicundus]|uniref:Uncharacterized protein n=1 Tax=Haloplanus rubicundus TaxID=1547898 RepID=A0A345E0M8_9EURY|nr:hypothetical protein [Haloplanus rubicundus]AXG05750.1 hypothetical protein DU500_04470 [Haloplanus rubicundus]AXG09087.1 hypothetical protein DU484_03990 [Haloplanus rubicundus]